MGSNRSPDVALFANYLARFARIDSPHKERAARSSAPGRFLRHLKEDVAFRRVGEVLCRSSTSPGLARAVFQSLKQSSEVPQELNLVLRMYKFHNCPLAWKLQQVSPIHTSIFIESLEIFNIRPLGLRLIRSVLVYQRDPEVA